MKTKILLLALVCVCSVFVILFGYEYRDSRARPALKDGILVCKAPPVPLSTPTPAISIPAVMEAMQNYQLEVADSLRGSENIDAQVIGAILAAEYGEISKVSVLESLALSNPQNELANVHLLSACTTAADDPICNTELATRALDVAGGNSLVWALDASMRHQQGDIEGAEAALIRAVSAPNYADYFRRHLRLLHDELPASAFDIRTEYNMGHIMSFAIGLFVNDYEVGLSLSGLCKDRGAERFDLGIACMRFGERMAQESSSMLASQLALALIEVTQEALGATEASTQQTLALPSEPSHQHASLLLELDEQFADAWLQVMLESGELVAQHFILEEARRLSSQPDYNPCPGPSAVQVFQTTLNKILALPGLGRGT